MAAGFKHYVADEDWTAVESDPVSASRVRRSVSFGDADLANQSPWNYLEHCAR
jgi:hypothetical protein